MAGVAPKYHLGNTNWVQARTRQQGSPRVTGESTQRKNNDRHWHGGVSSEHRSIERHWHVRASNARGKGASTGTGTEEQRLRAA